LQVRVVGEGAQVQRPGGQRQRGAFVCGGGSLTSGTELPQPWPWCCRSWGHYRQPPLCSSGFALKASGAPGRGFMGSLSVRKC
jgi:hypothetical protein